ncbi:MAG: DUF2975 domain-containing protein [Firmicutes bacterium]|nr:DUF2975 domain-containing protein [Bacillota bacterium]
MNQKNLALWLKIIVIGVGIAGLLIYFWLLPTIGKDLAVEEFKHLYWPYLITIWVTAVPIYWALVLAWKIFTNIGLDNSFCEENAHYLKKISILAACDCAYFFIMTVIGTFLNAVHPGILLIALFAIFTGIAIAVATAALSHLVYKAAALQDQSDLTI